MMISVQTTPTPLVQKLTDVAVGRGGALVVGTHDGCWHADELLAIAILKEAMPNAQVNVIRSRDPFMLSKADIVIDVGHGEFDHHQTGNKKYPNGIPYAACGLILDAVEGDSQLRNLLNYDLIFGVSARDNGYYDPHLGKLCVSTKLEWVGSFYPTWQEKALVEDGDLVERFYNVLDMVQAVYRRVRANCRARIESDRILPTCPVFNNRFIELPCGGIPWVSYGYEHQELLGAVHMDDTKSYWVVRVAKDSPDGFCNRVSFPAEWGGLEQGELARVSGIRDALFCHHSLFMATFKTRMAANAAMRMLTFIYENNQ